MAYTSESSEAPQPDTAVLGILGFTQPSIRSLTLIEVLVVDVDISLGPTADRELVPREGYLAALSASLSYSL